MSKNDFTREEFASRAARARAAIGAADLDWLLVIHPVSMRWLIGQDTKSYTIFQVLAVSAKPGPLILFTRGTDLNELASDTLADEIVTYGGGEPADPMEFFGEFVTKRGFLGSRIGMEVPNFYLSVPHYLGVKKILGEALVSENNSLLGQLRSIKSPEEINYTRKAADLSARAFEALITHVVEGRSELELAGAAYGSLLSNGSGIPHSTMNLMTGDRSAFALGGPTGRRQRYGDTGLVEIGANFRRYTSTLGRQWCLGNPSARLREIYDIVREAGDACLAKLGPGVPTIEAHEAAKEVISKAGFDQYRMHTTGYGIAPGFPPSWGEGVNIFGGSKDVLKENMIVSVEPNIFIAKEGLGARIIDNVLITATGVELLSTTSRDLRVVR